MVVDRYTKFVLTVIAACLVWLTVNSVGTTTHAQGDGFQRVVVIGWEDALGNVKSFPKTVERVASLPVKADGVPAQTEPK